MFFAVKLNFDILHELPIHVMSNRNAYHKIAFRVLRYGIEYDGSYGIEFDSQIAWKKIGLPRMYFRRNT